jgi:uncharacterized protein involved in exopolysaccharide biosynthesis
MNPELDPEAQRELLDTRKRMELGMEAEAFAHSGIGRYLLQQATELGEAALEKLADVQPTDERRIAELQRDVKLGRHIQTWLLQAVQDGANAEAAFRAAHSDDTTGD